MHVWMLKRNKKKEEQEQQTSSSSNEMLDFILANDPFFIANPHCVNAPFNSLLKYPHPDNQVISIYQIIYIYDG